MPKNKKRRKVKVREALKTLAEEEAQNLVDMDRVVKLAIAGTLAAPSAQEITVGFESTGPYGEPLFHYLKDKPVKLVQINPMHTKRVNHTPHTKAPLSSPQGKVYQLQPQIPMPARNASD